MTLHERMNSLENEARSRIRRVLSNGNEKLLEIDRALSRVDKQDWSVPGVKRQLDELRARAERTIKRAGELPGEAVSRLANGSRAPIQNLARGLAEMAKKMEATGEETPEAKTTAVRPVVSKPARAASQRRAENGGTAEAGAEE